MFRSFFLGGFEGAVGFNANRQWFDGVARTHHDRYLHEDYALLTSHNIHAVRECVRWPLVDTERGFDFSTLDALIEAGRRARMETIYDLFHFGFPHSLDIFSTEFLKRFTEYCYQVARRVSRNAEGPYYFTPVNEPSYFAWAAGEVGLFAPYMRHRGDAMKVALVRAAIHGTEAIWAACPAARLVSVDPFCRVVPDEDTPEAMQRADAFNSKAVFESWDMLAGRRMPELGGSPRHLDIVGINYYFNNQWVLDQPRVFLTDYDPRRMPLRKIVQTVWERYGREMILTETSHIGEARSVWIHELLRESVAIKQSKIPIAGICWYPVLEMSEWHDETWTAMGLWDLDHQGGSMRRLGHEPVLRVLRELRQELDFDVDDFRRSLSCG